MPLLSQAGRGRTIAEARDPALAGAARRRAGGRLPGSTEAASARLRVHAEASLYDRLRPPAGSTRRPTRDAPGAAAGGLRGVVDAAESLRPATGASLPAATAASWRERSPGAPRARPGYRRRARPGSAASGE